ncbi:heat shock 70 kDa protein 12A-like [Ylistrum balloti]|uniref:heat shock 70 kDa protein 12A-like n=1 Tax=Ylistrum balloti TaxID=509963 RepID=UPI002905D0E2|nr:heat shock 70 kDa protein 12A-like [Ylistrum balloti]
MASNTVVCSDDEDSNTMDDDGLSLSKTTLEPYMVAAIDFGTTYSGIAHSFKHDYKKDHLKIYCHKWYAKSGLALPSLKMPTTLLLTPDEEFEAFGYEAEERYTKLVDDNAHFGWHYFKHFKMNLYKPKVKLSRDTKLKDDQDQEVLALTVFAESIKYFKEMLHDNFKNAAIKPTDDTITWVLTIPAIWDNTAKQFMREAAVKAGIKNEHLLFALEPEAASVYCKEIHVQRKTGDEGATFLTSYDPGTKYMVADLGGGTADFTVREVMQDGSLKEVVCASGEAWGGMNVNKEFWKFIEQIVGKDQMKEAFQNCKAEQLDFERSIEQQKRDLRAEGDGNDIGIRLSLGALNEYVDESSAKKLQNTFRKGKVDIKKGKIKIPVTVIKDFFEPSVNSIKDHFEELFRKKETLGVNDVILVGGFAESKIMQEAVKTMLTGKKVVIPQECGLAVLKGAVLYGLNPGIVSARISQHTYGTQVHRFFLKDFDDEEMRDKKHRNYCKQVFNKLIEKDELVYVGKTVETEVFPLTADMTAMTISMYYSDQKNPKYTTGCTYLGKMTVAMPDTTGGLERKVVVSLHFGKTELVFEGRDENSKKSVTVKLDTLENRSKPL